MGIGETSNNPINNAAIKLLDESDVEVPECQVQPEKEIIQEFDDWVEANKSETSSQYWERTSPEKIAEKLKQETIRQVQRDA